MSGKDLTGNPPVIPQNTTRGAKHVVQGDGTKPASDYEDRGNSSRKQNTGLRGTEEASHLSKSSNTTFKETEELHTSDTYGAENHPETKHFKKDPSAFQRSKGEESYPGWLKYMLIDNAESFIPCVHMLKTLLRKFLGLL